MLLGGLDVVERWFFSHQSEIKLRSVKFFFVLCQSSSWSSPVSLSLLFSNGLYQKLCSKAWICSCTLYDAAQRKGAVAAVGSFLIYYLIHLNNGY
jgi:hypothetical protein